MTAKRALAEDLRRLGLILLAAGLVSGFLQEQVAGVAAVFAVVAGIVSHIVGYWLHDQEDKS